MQSPWLIGLKGELHRQIEAEMEITVQIAVMLAAKVSKREIQQVLGVSTADIQLAVQRLENVVGSWTD